MKRIIRHKLYKEKPRERTISDLVKPQWRLHILNSEGWDFFPCDTFNDMFRFAGLLDDHHIATDFQKSIDHGVTWHDCGIDGKIASTGPEWIPPGQWRVCLGVGAARYTTNSLEGAQAIAEATDMAFTIQRLDSAGEWIDYDPNTGLQEPANSLPSVLDTSPYRVAYQDGSMTYCSDLARALALMQTSAMQPDRPQPIVQERSLFGSSWRDLPVVLPRQYRLLHNDGSVECHETERELCQAYDSATLLLGGCRMQWREPIDGAYRHWNDILVPVSEFANEREYRLVDPSNGRTRDMASMREAMTIRNAVLAQGGGPTVIEYRWRSAPQNSAWVRL
jgi:hypothetical protein